MAIEADHTIGSNVEGYPNGRVINYNYASGIDDAIGRLSSITDGATTLESYSYLGLATVVARSHPQPGVDLTYVAASGTGDAGDKYRGLDRFGRIADQRWARARRTSTASSTRMTATRAASRAT